MRFFLASLAFALASGCTIEIPTSADTFSLEPARLSHLRRAQTIELVNGYSGPSTIQFGQSGHTFILDRMQLTNSVIGMLRKAMEQHGINVGPGGEKKITLRVVHAAVVSAPNAPAQATLEAQFGDGTTTVSSANNRGFSAQRALDGALLFTLNQLVIDTSFVAYVNK